MNVVSPPPLSSPVETPIVFHSAGRNEDRQLNKLTPQNLLYLITELSLSPSLLHFLTWLHSLPLPLPTSHRRWQNPSHLFAL